MAAAATAAVSTRRIVAVSPTGVKYALWNCRVSCSVQPPSGPMNSVSAGGSAVSRSICPMGNADASVDRYHAGESSRASASSMETTGAIRMTPNRWDCLAASTAIRCQRAAACAFRREPPRSGPPAEG